MLALKQDYRDHGTTGPRASTMKMEDSRWKMGAGTLGGVSPPASSGAELVEGSDVLVNLGLKLVDLVQRTFRQDGEVAGVLGQDVAAQRVESPIESLDLLDRLLQLPVVLNHRRSFNMPLRRPGSSLTSWKNSVQRSYSMDPSRATSRSKPKRWRTRRFERTLYAPGLKSARKSCSLGTTTMRSMSLGRAFPVTKLPFTRTPTTAFEASASRRNAPSLAKSRGRWSLAWKEPNLALISSREHSWMPSGRSPSSSRGGIGMALKLTAALSPVKARTV